MGVTCANQESTLHNQFSGWLMLACVSGSKCQGYMGDMDWKLVRKKCGYTVGVLRVNQITQDDGEE